MVGDFILLHKQLAYKYSEISQMLYSRLRGRRTTPSFKDDFFFIELLLEPTRQNKATLDIILGISSGSIHSIAIEKIFLLHHEMILWM